VGGVVAGGEVHGLGALRGDGDLVDVEVEVLAARRVGVVEGLDHPLDLVLAETELLGDGVGHRGLEALAVRRVVVVEPRRVGGRVGGDGQLALLVQRQRARAAVERRGRRAVRGRGRGGRGLGRARRGGQRDRRGGGEAQGDAGAAGQGTAGPGGGHGNTFAVGSGNERTAR